MRSTRLTSTAVVRVLLTCSLLLGASCESSASESQQPKVEPRTVKLADTPRPPKAQTPPFHLLKFELEDAGRAPHKEFRYEPMNFAVRATQTAAVREAKSDTEFTSETGLALTASGGSIEIVGLKAGGNSPSIDETNKAIRDQRATAIVTSRGILTELGGAASLDAKRELATMLLRHLVPVPVEPIGVGARWRVKYAVARGGVYIARTATYELKERATSEELALEVLIEESAEPQPILSDGAVSGKLHALKSEARGSLSVTTAMPMARGAALKSTSTFHARTPTGDEIFREASAQLTLSAVDPK